MVAACSRAAVLTAAEPGSGADLPPAEAPRAEEAAEAARPRLMVAEAAAARTLA
jgi:hypothetical protein